MSSEPPPPATDNPFQPPSADSPVIGVNSGSREDLRSVAISQKGIIVCILLYLMAAIGQLSLPETIRPLVGIGILGVGIVGTVFVFMLTTKVYPTGTGILLGILALIPCIGLFVLLVVNSKATDILRKNGIKVGFLGANLSRI